MYQLRLYVSGRTSASQRAIQQAESLREGLDERIDLDIVDVLHEARRAAEVLVIPTLVRVHPPPMRKVVGDLSCREAVLRALGLWPGDERP
jgi:circadian clock protein KaiB